MMKLSEAIRLGATMKPQHHNKDEFFVWANWLKELPLIRRLFVGGDCSCVFGAAIDAQGLDVDLINRDYELFNNSGWPKSWRPFLNAMNTCPQCGVEREGYVVTAHLNDFHRWSRERIADWVELQEGIEAAPVEEQLEVLQPGPK